MQNPKIKRKIDRLMVCRNGSTYRAQDVAEETETTDLKLETRQPFYFPVASSSKHRMFKLSL
jgi:hypothetical protein